MSSVLVDFCSTWRKVHYEPSSAAPGDFSDPDYDDSAWVPGEGPFGFTEVVPFRPGTATWCTLATVFPTLQTAVWIRQWVPDAREVTLRYDSDVSAWFNGVPLNPLQFQGPTNNAAPVLETVVALPRESGLLAVLAYQNVRGGADGSWFDMQVIGGSTVVRQYPRDDGKGLSAGPRLFPPPKGQRVVGGPQ